MTESVSATTHSPAEILRTAPVQQAANGICYAVTGQTNLLGADAERMISCVPQAIAGALRRKAFYFVPLAVAQGEQTVIADRYDVTLSDQAVCHRNLTLGDAECVFISTRLMDDRFSVAFEFYINVAHAFVEHAGFSQEFADLAWKQVLDKTKGETSLDAHELRKIANSAVPESDKAKHEYFETVFADAIAIYMLSLFLDVDYYELREREYPLLAPAALAERLRQVAELFPASPGFEFNIFYRRRPN
ncbi:MAG: hypothetical protein ABSD88_04470 [Candidatus Korobacteraceae bacterium]|jgi:hypothetical protein